MFGTSKGYARRRPPSLRAVWCGGPTAPAPEKGRESRPVRRVRCATLRGSWRWDSSRVVLRPQPPGSWVLLWLSREARVALDCLLMKLVRRLSASAEAAAASCARRSSSALEFQLRRHGLLDATSRWTRLSWSGECGVTFARGGSDGSHQLPGEMLSRAPAGKGDAYQGGEKKASL